MPIFGTYPDKPTPYNFWGISGFWSVPAGRNWYLATDSNGVQWASPEALLKNDDGTVSATNGANKYAVDMNADGTLVFIDTLANRHTGIDSPAPDRLSSF